MRGKTVGAAAGIVLLLVGGFVWWQVRSDDRQQGSADSARDAPAGLTPGPTAPTGPTGSTRGPNTSDTEEMLLPQQVQLQVGGDGLGLQCAWGDEPDTFDPDPGVRLNELYSPTEYPWIVMLCLRGFQADEPIEVETWVGGQRILSRVAPQEGSPPTPQSDFGYEEAPPTTLFESNGLLPVYTLDYDGTPIAGPPGVLGSEMWMFVPPEPARGNLAAAGSMAITATQGDTTATEVHEVAIPTTRRSFRVTKSGGDMTVLHGYPPGRVPMGLYLRAPSFEEANLVKKVDSVDIPASRVGTWNWPSNLFDGVQPGTYCVLPPVEGPTDCDPVFVGEG